MILLRNMQLNAKIFLRMVGSAMLMVAVGACGLSDYQRSMDEQRKRVSDFDEFNRLLEDPIETPRIMFEKTGEVKAWPEVYLRLPKGFGTMPKEKIPYLYPFPLYRYSGGDNITNIFIAAAWMTDPKGKEEWGLYTRPNFRHLLSQALEDFYLKTYKIQYAFPYSDKVEPKTRDVRVVGAYPDPNSSGRISFHWLGYSDEGNKLIKDHSLFEVFIREEAGKQIGIAFQRPLRNTNVGAVNQSIEYCLGTLEFSTNSRVETLRTQYRKAKGS